MRRASEQVAKVSEAEYVLKCAADILPSHMRIIANARAAKTVVTKLVVSLAFFRVAEYFVCLGALLELYLGFFFIVGVFVGMVLYRHAPVRAFNIVRRGIFRNP